MTPRRILMIKSHSMGVGDVLRSSAAWRVLKNKLPGVELHLLFLSKHAGYATESLIKQHHLLSSAQFVTVRAHDPSVAHAAKVPITQLIRQVQSIAKELQPDLIIDFEPHGMKTSLLTWMAAKACRAQTVGIAQFPVRSWFYDLCANSMPLYARAHGLQLPMDYTHRDFVALQALGLERGDTAIELRLSADGERFKQQLRSQLPAHLPVVGLNIGCGTQDALIKRPSIEHLAQCMSALYQQQPYTLVLSGAHFEKDVNQAFTQALQQIMPHPPIIFDMAGQTSLPESAGLIDACDLFITTDSGPYHMAVGLRRPTLVWFTYAETTSFHEHTWVRRVIQPTEAEFVSSASELEWQISRSGLHS